MLDAFFVLMEMGCVDVVDGLVEVAADNGVVENDVDMKNVPVDELSDECMNDVVDMLIDVLDRPVEMDELLAMANGAGELSRRASKPRSASVHTTP